MIEFVEQGLRISVPYVLAALGGTFSERGGTVNIALEGILLVGAFGFVIGTTFGVAGAPASPWTGVLVGIGFGVLLAAIHATVSVVLRGEQIVSGVALNLMALGVTEFFLELVFHSSANSPRVEGFVPGSEGVAAIPVVGEILGHPLILLAVLLVPVSHVVLGRTPFGLRLRAVGEHPVAAESVGVSVLRTRMAGVLISGGLAGLGGVYLASEQASFTSGMSAGRGYIALAAMIVGKWRAWPAAGAACLFGFAEAAQIRLQTMSGIALPPHLLQAIPYLLTLLVLCGFIGRAVPPRALGVPYRRERS